MPPVPYGDQVAPEDVSFTGATYANSEWTPGRYTRVSDGVLVVWVLPSNLAESGGFFALYTGDEADYTSTVVEAA